MEHCGTVPALHVAVEGEAAAQRVFQAAWLDVQLVDRVADLSNATLPQIVEKGPHVRIWTVEASLPSDLLAAHQEIPRLVSFLKQLVPGAQVAFEAECASNIDVEIRDSISRALNVKPIEVCSSSRCPIWRLRFRGNSLRSTTTLFSVPKEWAFWFSIRVKKDDAPQRGSAQDGLVPPTRRCPRKAPPRAGTGCASCDQQAVARWERDKFKFPPHHHLWQKRLDQGRDLAVPRRR